MKAALELLRLVPTKITEIGPTDPKQIVQKIVEAQRNSTSDLIDDLFNREKGLPPFDQHVAQTWKELERQAWGQEGEDSGSEN